MERVEKEIEIDAPVSVVYNQWTQFEEYPEYMEGVLDVHQLDYRRLYLQNEYFGKRLDWNADIYEQVPDTHIKWRSTAGMHNEGAIYFISRGERGDRTHLRVVFEYEPAEISENIAAAQALVNSRIQINLVRFRDFLERRGRETGGWRPEIEESTPR